MIEAATLDDRIRKVEDDVLGWRRHLHRNPELSFHEEGTSRFVHATLLSFGGLELSRPTPTSVVARLVGDRPGPAVALRADMDALPITEENDSEFVSRHPGVMHACGHDGHTAMLLGAARILSGMRDEISGEVRFLFQHAEETYPGGPRRWSGPGLWRTWTRLLGSTCGAGSRPGRSGSSTAP